MKKSGRDVEQIYDVIAFPRDHRVGARLLRRAGRRALELDAGAGRFKDFIALPKPTSTSRCTRR
jgi:hypothetical protein